MPKRERLEIVRDILQAVQNNHNSIRATPLLRKSKLSSRRFFEYLDKLLEKGFIKKNVDKKGSKFFILTDKGFKYLENYKTILGFIEEFEL